MLDITKPETFNCVYCDNPKCDDCLTDKAVCTLCFGDNSVRTTANACACPADNYYDAFTGGNALTYNCVPCATEKCKQCSSTSASTCDVCYGANRDASLACECLPGYRDVFVVGEPSTYDCVRCTDAPCETCDASESTCTQCFGLNRELVHACACPAGYRNYFE